MYRSEGSSRPSQQDIAPRRRGRAGFLINAGLSAALMTGIGVPAAVSLAEAGTNAPAKTDTATTLHLDTAATQATQGIDLTQKKVVLVAAPVASPVKATPQELKPGWERHTIGNDGTVSDIIVTSLNRQLGKDAKASIKYLPDLIALDAQASDIKRADWVNPDKPGTFGFVDTNGRLTKVLLDAENGKKDNNIDVVKEVAALHTAVKKGGYDAKAARTAAQAVIDKVGATVPTLDKKAAPASTHGHQEQGGTVAQVLQGVNKDVLQPQLDTKDLQAEVATAKTHGWVKTVELSAPTISHQLYEKGDTPAYTNLQDRVAVQATTFDKKLNPKGTFDEHRMDKGDKFNKPGPELQALFDGVSSLTVMDMLQIKKDHPALFPDVLKLWIINHRSTPHTAKEAQEVRLQDEEAMAALGVLVTYDKTKLDQAQVKFVQAINEAKTAEDRRKIVMTALAPNKDVLSSFFPDAPAGQTNPGPKAPGTEVPRPRAATSTGESITIYGHDIPIPSNPWDLWTEAEVGGAGVLAGLGVFGGRRIVRRRRQNP